MKDCCSNWKFCAECGSKLESEYCECNKPKPYKHILERLKKEVCRHCSKLIKPKKELPEKLNIMMSDEEHYHIQDKINEILKYLEDK